MLSRRAQLSSQSSLARLGNSFVNGVSVRSGMLDAAIRANAESRHAFSKYKMAFAQFSCDNCSVSIHSDTDEHETQPSMLLAFRGQNLRSFRDPFELSLLSTSLVEPGVAHEVPWRIGGKPVGVLPTAAVYGANASGKSNVLRAMNDMRSHVLFSFRAAAPGGGFPRRAFLLGANKSSPSYFEVDLVLEGVRHGYGFVADDQHVLEEWAVYYPHGREALLFKRTGEDVELGASIRAKARATLELLRPNALFLSTDAAVKQPALSRLFGWFARNLVLAEAESRASRQALTTRMLEDPATRDGVLEMLRAADLGVSDAKHTEMDPVMRERFRRALRILEGIEAESESGADEGPDLGDLGVRLVHEGAVGLVEFEQQDESLGTLVWFGLVGPILESLARGSVFLADELDSSLHPALVAELVRLFQDSSTNRRRAQLVFNSHDATLLGDSASARLLGRDQVWFTEKNPDGSSHLYPLSGLDPRKEEAIGRRYLAGRYGAKPIVSHQEFAAAAELVVNGRPS